MGLGAAIKNLAIRGSRFAVAHSPEIFMGIGTIGVVTGAVIIGKRSTKLEELLASSKEEQDKIKEYGEAGEVNGREYTQEDVKKDLFVVKKEAAIKIIKTEAPGALILIAGISCYFVAFGIMKRRQAALAVALASANKAFEEYRARVIADQGEEKDKEYLYGLKKEKIETVDPETGKKVKEEVLTSDGTGSVSRYAVRFTPQYSTEASADINYNTQLLKVAENSFNMMLPGQKKIFLNQVYAELGIDETYESRLVGWDYYADNHGDGKIQFIITEVVERDDNDPSGYHKELIVDFNVDGNVAYKLPRNSAALGMEVEDHITKAERLTEYT